MSPSRSASRARALTTAAVLACLSWLAPLPAEAVVPGACTPEPGVVEVLVDAPAGVKVLETFTVTLTVVDTCGEVDTSFRGLLNVTAYAPAGGDGNYGSQRTLTEADRGVVTTQFWFHEEGIYHFRVYPADYRDEIGGSAILVFGPEGYPVVDDLAIEVGEPVVRISGIVAAAADPAAPVQGEIRVGGQLVRTFSADLPAEPWADAPPSIGDEHGFDEEVVLPAGTHQVCLYLGGVGVDCETVTFGRTAGPPFGWLDGVFRTPSGLVAAGWAVDPSSPGGVATVEHSGSRTATPRTFGGPLRTYTLRADGFRADVGAAHPAWGPQHGFVSFAALGVGEGSVATLCAKVGSLQLGCAAGTMRYSPLGSFDNATVRPGGAVVRGWAVDQDTYGPVDVHLYVDGRPAVAARADRPRPDVSAAFPPSPGGLVPGYGADHGFETTLALAAGRHRLCAYGIDVKDQSGSGSNTLLGCRDVDVPSATSPDPVGRVDAATRVPGGFTLRGWTADPDAPTTPLQVHTYRDGVGAAITTADQTRPDLAALDGGRYGTAHGYTIGTITTGATARVCTYALNVGAGQNTTLACQDLARPLTPTGSLDETTRTSPTTATVRGWALDPDTAAPVDIHVYVDGRPAAVGTADTARGDISAAFPGWGAAHGYSLTVPATPGQRVCTYAINTAQGSSNTTLGCRTA